MRELRLCEAFLSGNVLAGDSEQRKDAKDGAVIASFFGSNMLHRFGGAESAYRILNGLTNVDILVVAGS